jgi:hypothetical protein
MVPESQAVLATQEEIPAGRDASAYPATSSATTEAAPATTTAAAPTTSPTAQAQTQMEGKTLVAEHDIDKRVIAVMVIIAVLVVIIASK